MNPTVWDQSTFEFLCSFHVFELPKPQGSKKIVGPYRMADATNVSEWRNAVIKTGATEYGDREPCDEPIVAIIDFFLPRPKSLAKKYLHPKRKPDIDKLIRSTFDGLTLAGVITDDSRIVHLTTSKQFVTPDQPVGAFIHLCRLKES